jgi:hypothetical protein
MLVIVSLAMGYARKTSPPTQKNLDPEVQHGAWSVNDAGFGKPVSVFRTLLVDNCVASCLTKG